MKLSELAKIRIKLGNAEIEVEEEISKIRELVDIVPELISKITHTSEYPIKTDVTSQEPTEASPAIKIEKDDSLSNIIEKLFSSSWGLKERKLSEIREALRNYGLNYPKQSVAVSLLRLAKAGKIRRFKSENGEYAYTSVFPQSSNLVIEPEQDLKV